MEARHEHNKFTIWIEECQKITEFLQTKHSEKHGKFATAKSFVHRALKRDKTAAEQPHLEPHRDRRDENRKSKKRKDSFTVTLVDELLSESKATGPKVREQLISLHGITISVARCYDSQDCQRFMPSFL